MRSAAQCRNWVTADGSPGPSGEGGFKAEPGRYHLYVSLACPWAHRTLIFRKLKGLEGMIGVSVVHWLMAEHGWTFEPAPGRHRRPALWPALPARALCPGDTALYRPGDRAGAVGQGAADDRQQRIRPRSSACWARRSTASAPPPGDYYPAALRAEIDAVNERVYAAVNNGVYRAGFATTQAAYEEAFDELFATLDWLEERLARQRYLVGRPA